MYLAVCHGDDTHKKKQIIEYVVLQRGRYFDPDFWSKFVPKNGFQANSQNGSGQNTSGSNNSGTDAYFTKVVEDIKKRVRENIMNDIDIEDIIEDITDEIDVDDIMEEIKGQVDIDSLREEIKQDILKRVK